MNYLLSQQWDSLLFAHWSVAKEDVQALLPSGMEVDVAEGKAWVAVVPFQMSNIHFRGLPKVPGFDAFAELNVRTYVKVNGVPGVYFFSLDANHRLGVWIANKFFHLKYRYAEMYCKKEAESITFRSSRFVGGEEKSVFRGTYRSLGEPILLEELKLTKWLTERYHLFTTNAKGQLFRGDVMHPPWTLERVEADLTIRQLTSEHGLKLEGVPELLCFSQMLGVRVTAISRI